MEQEYYEASGNSVTPFYLARLNPNSNVFVIRKNSRVDIDWFQNWQSQGNGANMEEATFNLRAFYTTVYQWPHWPNASQFIVKRVYLSLQ
jgi:hypothetical protein